MAVQTISEDLQYHGTKCIFHRFNSAGNRKLYSSYVPYTQSHQSGVNLKYSTHLSFMHLTFFLVMFCLIAQSSAISQITHSKLEHGSEPIFKTNTIIPVKQEIKTDPEPFIYSTRELHFCRDSDDIYPIVYPMLRYHSPPLGPLYEVNVDSICDANRFIKHPVSLKKKHLTRSGENVDSDAKNDDVSNDKSTQQAAEKKNSTKSLEQLEKHMTMMTGIYAMMDRLLSIQRPHSSPVNFTK